MAFTKITILALLLTITLSCYWVVIDNTKKSLNTSDI